MKKLVGIAVVASVFMIGTTSVFSAGSYVGRNYIDTNNDGICDYAGAVCRCAHTGRRQPYGGKVLGTGCGQNFADADGDGICDNHAARTGRFAARRGGLQRVHSR